MTSGAKTKQGKRIESKRRSVRKAPLMREQMSRDLNAVRKQTMQKSRGGLFRQKDQQIQMP